MERPARPRIQTWETDYETVPQTLALALACTAFFVWAGGRVFRVGILMQGKSATFAEMWRWIRAG